MAPPDSDRDWLDDALYGRLCLRCKKARTKNPSKTCSACLGARACPACNGTALGKRGQDTLTACPTCDGDGLRREGRP